MNYIGSKQKLSDFLKSHIDDIAKPSKDTVFCDIFAGTGAVGRIFKKDVKKVIANDREAYSFTLCRNYIGNHEAKDRTDMLDELNDLSGVQGFVFEHYSFDGVSGRQYFSSENGQKIDAIRTEIDKWLRCKKINEDDYYFLLASLLEAADKVANTASVYGAYLKHLKKSAEKPLGLKPALYDINDNSHEVYNEDANELIKKIEGDILYLDPPYNAREYGANYHLLNTIALYDDFLPKGKTGLRDYERSRYCKKNEAKVAFEELIKNAKFKYIFLSYNNEGLMGLEETSSIMQKYGHYDLAETTYQRFRADKSNSRNHKADTTVEYLHILEKNG